MWNSLAKPSVKRSNGIRQAWNSLSVSQALSTDRQAEDQYISALYQHNVAKLSLARALGVASTNYKQYLGGK